MIPTQGLILQRALPMTALNFHGALWTLGMQQITLPYCSDFQPLVRATGVGVGCPWSYVKVPPQPFSTFTRVLKAPLLFCVLEKGHVASQQPFCAESLIVVEMYKPRSHLYKATPSTLLNQSIK